MRGVRSLTLAVALTAWSAVAESPLDGPIATGRGFGNVSGTIHDSWGHPIAGTIVALKTTTHLLEVRSDSSGGFLVAGVDIDADGDSATVSVPSDPRIPPTRIFIPPGAVLSPRISLQPGSTLVLPPRSPAVLPSASVAFRSAAPDPSVAGPWSVFATREGLVGFTTANGHVIRLNDRFVALPSRRALAPSDTSRDYLVRLRRGSASVVVPVWDVGPWNIRDDWWHDTLRETFAELPRGLPQAMAAFRDGHNQGLDGSGRKVLNGAGIDLADGVFWGDLGMSDNGAIEVQLLWKLEASSGNRVRLRQWANVRDSAAGRLLRKADCGETGTIAGAARPGVSGGRWYLYWPVKWDVGGTGWVVENYLTRDSLEVACGSSSVDRASVEGASVRRVSDRVLSVRMDRPGAILVRRIRPDGRILSLSSTTGLVGRNDLALEPARSLEIVQVYVDGVTHTIRRVP